MFDCGMELAGLFREVGATKVLTAEISGIARRVARLEPMVCIKG